MEEPFDIFIGATIYSVFPEEDNSYTIFKEGKEYVRIQKDTEGVWLKLDYESDLPIFDEDTEVNEIGAQINVHESD
jgi:hypothetical protein